MPYSAKTKSKLIREQFTQEFLKSLFNYDPITGFLTYKINCNHMKIGDRAGALSGKGHRQISINGKYYKAQNLIWVYMTGEQIPEEMLVDHKNRDYDGNFWENLRLATEAQNRGNSKVHCTNTSGYKGVSFHKSSGKWMAYIYKQNKQHRLGYFANIEDAAKAYQIAASEYFGEFANFE